jgi:hypothetical protein
MGVDGLDQHGRLCGQIEETLRVAQEAKAAAVPYWHTMRHVVAVDGLTVTLSAPMGAVLGRASAVWWYHPDTDTIGTALVDFAQGAEIVLPAVPAGLTAGAWLAPVLLGVIESVGVQELNGAARSYTIDFHEDIGNAHGTTRTVREALGLGIGLDGLIENLSPERTAEDGPVVLGITVTGSYVAIVVARETGEAAALGISLSGGCEQIAFPRAVADAATLGITLSGTYL